MIEHTFSGIGIELELSDYGWSPVELDERRAKLRTLIDAFSKDWRGAAACGPTAVPMRWFDEGNEDTRTTRIRQARQVCAVCPVKVECLADGMANESGMIHAGTTPGMRATARRKHQSIGWLLDWVRRETVEQVWPPTRAVGRGEWVA